MAHRVETWQDRQAQFDTFMWFLFVFCPIAALVALAFFYWYIALPVAAVAAVWWQAKGRFWWRQKRLDAEAPQAEPGQGAC